jgi:glycosyltransferase involved in cell wall biosynthesis
MKNIILLIKYSLNILINLFSNKKLILISESANWVIKSECINIKNIMDKIGLINSQISLTPYGLRNKIIHFTSENTLIGENGIKHHKKTNKFVFTWFHISNADKYRLRFIPELNDRVDFVHTACAITKEKLIANGLREEKIALIPLGVDLNIFKPITQEEKILLRKKLGLPTDKIIIGSFQKDGNGWGKGLEPKLIKGPDIFCDVIKKLSEKFNIHIMLTGPARGYVKKHLRKENIPYSHIYFEDYYEIAKYYQVLDLYLICSREEGGPKALLESMACGIPLVSTRVGMVPDVLKDGTDGFIAEIENTDEIINKTEQTISNNELREKFIKNSLEKIQDYAIEKITRKYYDQIYSKLI